ncbi:MAG TPA: 23S rRNA (pseudouridine(1915)-N(3))-methyltransferase RlmH [Longimicrobiales bacterium]|nr:23S rRNA (pseudouridine(1915)-N(3))-methyltransferase RlmH [Longimicrobiales bacterium]
MRVAVVAVGRVRGVLEPAVRDYEERAGRYWKLDVIEVAAGAPGGAKGGDAAARVRRAEADRILGALPDGLEVVALTRTGRPTSSRELAAYLEELGTRAHPGAAFVIGGAFGLDASVLERARRALSLSALTLPHEMARLVLAEQLYRAGTLVRGEPYHKS